MPIFSQTEEYERQKMNLHVGKDGHFSHCLIGDDSTKREDILDDLFDKLQDEKRWERLTHLEKYMVESWVIEAKETGYIRLELVTLLCAPHNAKRNFRFEDMKLGCTVTFDMPVFRR